MRLQMINKAVTSTFGEYTCCIFLNTVIFSTLIIIFVNVEFPMITTPFKIRSKRHQDVTMECFWNDML